jgi:hypothetical protein
LSKLVGICDVADRGEVQVATLERITAHTAEDRVARLDNLDDVVRASGPLLETSQVIGVHDVHLRVLAHRHGKSADGRSLEGGCIQQRKTR